MKKLLFLLLLITILFLLQKQAWSQEINEFEILMSNWNKKITLASEYLRNAELALKEGDKFKGCINQKKAGKIGVEASESLIKAFELKKANKREIGNLKNGLNKWKELRDFC